MPTPSEPSNRTSHWVLVTFVAASGACATAPPTDRTGSSSQPLFGGTPSDASQDAVVLVLHASATSREVQECSGTMLTPRLVLTARHCVASTATLVTCPTDTTTQSGGTVSADFAATDMYVIGGAERPDLTSTFSTGIPGMAIFDDGADTLCNHDLALILLSRDLPGTKIAPVRLTAPTPSGEATTLVGWGLDETQALPSARLQLTGQGVLAAGPTPTLGAKELLIGKGSCEGDSGGPALAASGAVIGLLSRGESTAATIPMGRCTGNDIGLYTTAFGFEQLIRFAYAQAGQEPWIEGQPNPTLAKLDASCTSDSDCQSNHCSPSSKTCVQSPMTASDSTGGNGCAIARGGAAPPPRGFGFAVALAAALAGMRRAHRREGRGGLSSPCSRPPSRHRPRGSARRWAT